MKRNIPDVSITEQPTPLHGWRDSAADPMAVIAADTAGLMRQLAETQATLRDRDRERTEALRKLLLAVLAVGDAFDRVFKSVSSKPDQVTPQMKIWLGNFRAARRLVDKLLGEQGVVRIENLDQGFDPHWHKVADVRVDTAAPEGTIVEEVLKGYIWQNQVLRKAEVVVVRHAAGEADESGEPEGKGE